MCFVWFERKSIITETTNIFKSKPGEVSMAIQEYYTNGLQEKLTFLDQLHICRTCSEPKFCNGSVKHLFLFCNDHLLHIHTFDGFTGASKFCPLMAIPLRLGFVKKVLSCILCYLHLTEPLLLANCSLGFHSVGKN